MRMVPDSIRSILTNHPEVADVYKLKFANNQPFLQNLGIEFFHTEKEDGRLVSTTRFFWDGPAVPVLDTIYRLYDAYDADGKNTD